jgi:hypothetical protein
MDGEKTELERKLKELVRHNHPVPLMYDPDNGFIVQAPPACDCRSPRFEKVCVKVEHPGAPKLPVSVAVPQPESVHLFSLNIILRSLKLKLILLLQRPRHDHQKNETNIERSFHIQNE